MIKSCDGESSEQNIYYTKIQIYAPFLLLVLNVISSTRVIRREHKSEEFFQSYSQFILKITVHIGICLKISWTMVWNFYNWRKSF